MISLSNKIISKIKNDLDKNKKISIRTYKNDRGFTIYFTNSEYVIKEDGFFNKEYKLKDWQSSKKILKKIFKTEFPRSNNIRYNIS